MLHILTIDGGPAALVQVHVLEYLEGHVPGFLDSIDLFAGTSDGGIMSLFLAMRCQEAARDAHGQMLPGEALKVIKDAQGFLRQYAGAFLKERSVWGFLTGRTPLAAIESFHRCLEDRFRDAAGRPLTLGDLKKKVAIVSYDTLARVPRVFRNFGKDTERDNRIRLVEVARATSSLPLITPVFGGPDTDVHEDGSRRLAGYVDGVLCANNPGMTAVSMAITELADTEANPLKAIRLLSLGISQTAEEEHIESRGGLIPSVVMLFTRRRNWRFYLRTGGSLGTRIRFIIDEKFRDDHIANPDYQGIGEARWGWFEGLVRRPTLLLDLMIHGLSGEVDRQCKRTLGKHQFFRFEPRINVMREMTDLLLFGGHKAHDTLLGTAIRSADPNARNLSGDEQVNARKFLRLVKWLKADWQQPYRANDPSPAPAPAAAPASPVADVAD